METFMNDDFLLSTPTARRLYHEVAERMPIIDYHCHISPREIAKDRVFDSITQVWLGGDHYKWRQMRFAGVPEEFITGEADPREKFRAFASVLPKLIGNPIYHWSHLELQRVFGIREPLNAGNADEIYDRCSEKLKTLSARQLIRRFDVRVICTTDDPCDDLCWHEAIAADETMEVRVLPTFRPDRAVNVEKDGFRDYIEKLSDICGFEIAGVSDVERALLARIEYFDKRGCVCADHGLDSCIFEEPDREQANAAFTAAMKGECPEKRGADAYKTLLLTACAKRYAKLGWGMQIHFGCLRNNNRIQFEKLGADTGYDAVNSRSEAENAALLLNAFEENHGLPKTILYSLNPNDNAALVTVAGCFQGGDMAGRVQQGSAWWFNDNRDGMRAQLKELANNGMLGCFVGMLTDSRSFLSYTRHEYFRRILCELIGEWVESGQYPDDWEQLKALVEDICFNNVKRFFGF